jgi:hypothetical protein
MEAGNGKTFSFMCSLDHLVYGTLEASTVNTKEEQREKAQDSKFQTEGNSILTV